MKTSFLMETPPSSLPLDFGTSSLPLVSFPSQTNDADPRPRSCSETVPDPDRTGSGKNCRLEIQRHPHLLPRQGQELHQIFGRILSKRRMRLCVLLPNRIIEFILISNKICLQDAAFTLWSAACPCSRSRSVSYVLFIYGGSSSQIKIVATL